MVASRIDAIGEQNDCFSYLYVIEVLVDYLIDRIIKAGSAARTCFHDCLPECCMIIQWQPNEKPDLIVQRHNHHAIVWLELIYEGDGGILHLIKLEVGRAARVDHQHNRKWLFGGREICHLLFNAVIPKSKILFAQIRNILAITIHYAHRTRDERRVNSDDIACPDFFRPILGGLTVFSARRPTTRIGATKDGWTRWR